MAGIEVVGEPDDGGAAHRTPSAICRFVRYGGRPPPDTRRRDEPQPRPPGVVRAMAA